MGISEEKNNKNKHNLNDQHQKSDMDFGSPVRFNPEFLAHLDEWFTDERIKEILFYTPEEEKALAEKKEEDRKILKPEYFDESNY